jgi:quercetin dioxygenase-like cupin family protein
MTLSRLLVFSACMYSAIAVADENKLSGVTKLPYSLTPIIKQAMSDPSLAGYEMLAVRLNIVPGGVDPAPHRHDADLFVYVLQGKIEVELDGHTTTHKAGSMFHEPRNVLHSLLRNTSTDTPASALAIFVIKSGREFFIPMK